ncbi:hypothetical protein AWC38_SpisGene18796 [Stylophora pistillata]|uniref:C2H2-type domain-containing protein n=1 Tax=Stylophora pistillata TaxID=50429 RepID=A0A2B4RKA4_STYPI|nr:hypothetical protein AWC38_SpisGene18796 [Stylophora pistillata]
MRKIALTIALVLNLQRVIPELTTASFEISLFHYLDITPLDKRLVVDPIDCSFACLRNIFCVSFNVAAVASEKGKYWCELLSSIVNTVDAKLVADHGSHHYSISQPIFSLFYRILAEVKSVPVVGSVQEYRSETDPSNAFVNPDILESSVKLKMQQIVKDNKTLVFYSDDQKNDLLYDIQKSSEAIVQWKAHIMRSVNQECAKPDIIVKLDQTLCLLVIDWAMKSVQLRYREKQSDWYGKRGLSWHISSVVSRSQSNTMEVISYAHLFDKCTQDWYVVTSILEDLLKQLKVKNPLLQKVHLRSDEAGCYHNSSLATAVRDVAKGVGVEVHSYHNSEPQSGKDICDRIFCPMKSSNRAYCNEGHDVLTAVDIRDALRQHSVKGITAAVSIVDESKNTLCINKIEHFISFHNFEYGDTGLRVWKCYGIGKGKYIPNDVIYIKHQGETSLQTMESQGFYDPPEKRVVKRRSKDSKETEITTPKFECSVLGCVEVFETFLQLELHLDVGKHTVSRLSQYDAVKRDWALKFSSIDTAGIECWSCSSDSSIPLTSPGDTSSLSPLRTGWAASKPRGSVRF